MCAKCDVAKAEVWAEIRDLMDFTDGPLTLVVREQYSEIVENHPMREISEALGVEADWEGDALEALRCAMIAMRLAFVCTFARCKDHGNPPSLILNEWAGILFARELNFVRENPDEAENGAESQIDLYHGVMGNLIAGERGF